MARYIQRDVYCPKCDKRYVGVLVKEDPGIYTCKECGMVCDILPPQWADTSTCVSHSSRSYKFGRHINDVKKMKDNVQKGMKK